MEGLARLAHGDQFQLFLFMVGGPICIIGGIYAFFVKHKQRNYNSEWFIPGAALVTSGILFCLITISFHLEKNKQFQNWLYVLEQQVKLEKTQKDLETGKTRLTREERVLSQILAVLEKNPIGSGMVFGGRNYDAKEIDADVAERIAICRQLKNSIKRYEAAVSGLTKKKTQTDWAYSEKKDKYFKRFEFNWEKPEFVEKWKEENRARISEAALDDNFEIDWGTLGKIDWLAPEDFSALKAIKDYFAESEAERAKSEAESKPRPLPEPHIAKTSMGDK